MKQLVYLVLLASTFLNAQESKIGKLTTAINWSRGLNWEEVKAKAKEENKFILVDCYATWCGPCKKMEREVFVNDSVGDAVNKKYIAIEVQMDTSKNDKESTKNWYADAHLIMQLYHVAAFPTFLFFSPAGEIVHRLSGYMDAKRFILLTEDALNPTKQYYTLLRNYKKGEIEYKNIPYLVSLASRSGEKDIEMNIALDYLNNYVLRQDNEKIFTKENLNYITAYVKSSKERAFHLIYENPAKVNKVLDRPGFAEDWIHYIITNQDIQPKIFSGNEASISVHWSKLYAEIKRKFNPYYADRTILDAKSRWCAAKKQWSCFTKLSVEFVEKYGANMVDFDLATKAWSVFSYSENKNELNTAIKWTRRILDRSKDSSNTIPAVMDTYANLVYKVSYLFNDKKSGLDAIAIENNALAIANKYKVQNFQEDFAKTIEKMKKDEMTWENVSNTSDNID